jgi:SAM-dependent methyltransferase
MKDSYVNITTILFTTPSTTLVTSLVAAAILGYIFLSAQRCKHHQPTTTPTPPVVLDTPSVIATTYRPFVASEYQVIPFVVLVDPEWKDIARALERYEEEVAVLMNGLSRSLEVAKESEWDLFPSFSDNEFLLSKQLQRRINRMAVLLENNTRLLQNDLLLPFPVTKLLPKEDSNNARQETFKHTPSEQEPPHRVTKEDVESSSYDCVAQVMAHITRDWTRLGRLVRQRTYDWCRQEISSRLAAADSSILIPGAGLGRLAFDLASLGYSVEANELSLLMASAAHAILQRKVQATLCPFLNDFFTNEVESEWRYEAVEFPDVDTTIPMSGSLSFSVGDFVETYANPHRLFDGIVTCFFLDTATNIYEYLWTIQNVLRVDGVWVHVGPLQWHRNALLHPSANELRGLIESFGFEILHWSIDSQPIDYRYESTTKTRSTKYEAFKPLRMVAVRRETAKSSLLPRFLQRQRHKPKQEPTRVSSIPSHVVIEEL